MDPGKKRILVVEDDPHCVKIVSDMLTAHGFEVLKAPDGLDGIIDALEKLPDLIILDIMMPNIDGLKVSGTLRGTPQGSRIPIIMLTAKDAAEDVREGYDWGADRYITKPFDPDHLLQEVKNLLGLK